MGQSRKIRNVGRDARQSRPGAAGSRWRVQGWGPPADQEVGAELQSGHLDLFRQSALPLTGYLTLEIVY